MMYCATNEARVILLNKEKRMDVLLKIENLNKIYKSGSGELGVLRDVNMNVKEATSLSISGESGSGKSTLLNLIAAFDDITSGSIKFGEKEISVMTEKEKARYRSSSLGFIFQFHYLLRDFTALENIFMPAFMLGFSRKEATCRAEELLREVGLEERGNHYPSELSGGERQRVAVARSLVNDPPLILADEPTGNLDPENAKKVGELLFSLVNKHKKTLILVTHDACLAKKADFHYSIENASLEETT